MPRSVPLPSQQERGDDESTESGPRQRNVTRQCLKRTPRRARTPISRRWRPRNRPSMRTRAVRTTRRVTAPLREVTGLGPELHANVADQAGGNTDRIPPRKSRSGGAGDRSATKSAWLATRDRISQELHRDTWHRAVPLRKRGMSGELTSSRASFTHAGSMVGSHSSASPPRRNRLRPARTDWSPSRARPATPRVGKLGDRPRYASR